MKAYLGGRELVYSDLTWEQLCDDGLLVVNDGLPPYDLNPEAEEARRKAFISVTQFSKQWGGTRLGVGLVNTMLKLPLFSRGTRKVLK